jgi:hypothetical protein
VHIHTHLRMCALLCVCARERACACLYACIFAWFCDLCVVVYVCACEIVRVCVCVCAFVYSASMFFCVSLCVHVFMYDRLGIVSMIDNDITLKLQRGLGV